MIQKGRTGGDQFETSALADQQMNWWVTDTDRRKGCGVLPDRAQGAHEHEAKEHDLPLDYPMKRTWTIIGVGDMPGSLKWYQALFGQPAILPAHDYFGQILDSDGTVLLCLHEWGAHEHPSLMSSDHRTPGNGLLLFFRVDDFDLALQRARSLVTWFEEEPHVNPNTQTKEF